MVLFSSGPKGAAHSRVAYNAADIQCLLLEVCGVRAVSISDSYPLSPSGGRAAYHQISSSRARKLGYITKHL